MRERQEDGLYCQIIPECIQSGGPHQYFSLTDQLFGERDGAVVITSEHLNGVARWHLKVPGPEEPGSREVPAPRSSEDLEDRVVVLQKAQATSPALLTLHRSGKDARK